MLVGSGPTLSDPIPMNFPGEHGSRGLVSTGRCLSSFAAGPVTIRLTLRFENGSQMQAQRCRLYLSSDFCRPSSVVCDDRMKKKGLPRMTSVPKRISGHLECPIWLAFVLPRLVAPSPVAFGPGLVPASHMLPTADLGSSKRGHPPKPLIFVSLPPTLIICDSTRRSTDRKHIYLHVLFASLFFLGNLLARIPIIALAYY